MLHDQIIKVTGGGLPKEVIIGHIYRPPRMLHDQIIKVTGGGLPKEVILSNINRPPKMLHDHIRQCINELVVLIANIENKNEVILAGE